MYRYRLHNHINSLLKDRMDIAGADNLFYARFLANTSSIELLYNQLYSPHPNGEEAFKQLIETIVRGHLQRPDFLKQKDHIKEEKENWFLSNAFCGMSLYVDRFCGSLKNLGDKLPYFEKLGVNFLHLMPLFESPGKESDGGYAVSNFRKIDQRFGSLEQLRSVQEKMNEKELYLMLDIVLNHTSRQHEWAKKAKEGNAYFQDYFYFFEDRTLPDVFDRTMPDIFPESAPGNFTFVPECGKWVMTVFHNYQWDLNYANPYVLVEMLDIIFFYANLGVDLLRIDAPAFIWKQQGTTSQNLPQAHSILQLIKQCVQVAAPGMALLGEAIVAPKEIMKYFGTGEYTGRECDFAYNATQMALQWDALATGNVQVMMAAQHELLKKPFGASWITYTRSHDDIGLGYDDYMIEQAGFNPYQHRQFLKHYFSGNYNGSLAAGALFSYNPKTGDARISGTLASLCGLETALKNEDEQATEMAVRRILLMQAMSFFLGGMPMLFYGDEVGYTNDYSFSATEGKSYDNRWMHRPVIDWEKINKIDRPATVEYRIFRATQQLIRLRKKLNEVADLNNIRWIDSRNIHIAGFIRYLDEQRLICLFNFSDASADISWYVFKEAGNAPVQVYEHWSEKNYTVGPDNEYFTLEPFRFYLFAQKK